jgi:hypothetical protein
MVGNERGLGVLIPLPRPSRGTQVASSCGLLRSSPFLPCPSPYSRCNSPSRVYRLSQVTFIFYHYTLADSLLAEEFILSALLSH